MRHSHATTTVAALTAGLTAAVILSRRAARRLPAVTTAPAASLAPAPAIEGVVLPFVRPVPAPPETVQPMLPARCGDSGGQTKSGAPCAARATTSGRCHHHRLAA